MCTGYGLFMKVFIKRALFSSFQHLAIISTKTEHAVRAVSIMFPSPSAISEKLQMSSRYFHWHGTAPVNHRSVTL